MVVESPHDGVDIDISIAAVGLVSGCDVGMDMVSLVSELTAVAGTVEEVAGAEEGATVRVGPFTWGAHPTRVKIRNAASIQLER